jgi:hypothetical protein
LAQQDWWGVSDFASQKSPWYSLIHGSGMSEKQGMTGGSKGIGKYATFVNSAFRTVFYSTTTINHEVGYEGHRLSLLIKA